MRLKFLLLVSLSLYLGCTEITTTPSSVSVDIANPTTGTVGTGTVVPPIVLPVGVTLIADPPDIEGNPGQSIWVTVTAFKDGLEVAGFDVDGARVINPLIANVADIDGRQVQFRLNSLGSTSAIIEALGAFVPLSVWVR